MFKIATIQTESNDERIRLLTHRLEGMEFSITVKNSNSRQLDSDIDSRIVDRLEENYSVFRDKSSLLVSVDGEKVGELDGKFRDETKTEYYLEIEKSNKKTIWFDYIKLLTCLSVDDNGFGVLICPTNYAHKVGVWNLYKDAVVYKNHLQRVFTESSLDRVAVIGYTQYANINGSWEEYDSSVVNHLKNS